mmetsp:Transcript_41856/g.48528  ORF Transcript_41856/g.48528 Transcript_41856/m.48528 type:complete len:226 (+) Transcript_41856:40-717(+)
MLKSLSKTTVSLLKTPSSGFCAYVRYLDPSKHITMNHNFQNVCEDHVKLGSYLLPTRESNKLLSQKYVPEIVNIVYSQLGKAGVKLDASKYEEHRDLTWEELGVKFEDHVGEIMLNLSKNIFVTEHKFRPAIEQRKRYQLTNSLYAGANLSKNSVGLFFDSYNSFLWRSIERSNGFREPKIVGKQSFTEKSVEDGLQPPTSIPELFKDAPENKNLINRIMAYMHS